MYYIHTYVPKYLQCTITIYVFSRSYNLLLVYWVTIYILLVGFLEKNSQGILNKNCNSRISYFVHCWAEFGILAVLCCKGNPQLWNPNVHLTTKISLISDIFNVQETNQYYYNVVASQQCIPPHLLNVNRYYHLDSSIQKL